MSTTCRSLGLSALLCTLPHSTRTYPGPAGHRGLTPQEQCGNGVFALGITTRKSGTSRVLAQLTLLPASPLARCSSLRMVGCSSDLQASASYAFNKCLDQESFPPSTTRASIRRPGYAQMLSAGAMVGRWKPPQYASHPGPKVLVAPTRAHTRPNPHPAGCCLGAGGALRWRSLRPRPLQSRPA